MVGPYAIHDPITAEAMLTTSTAAKLPAAFCKGKPGFGSLTIKKDLYASDLY